MERASRQDFVHTRAVRRAALAYVGAAALTIGVAGASADEPHPYLTIWAASGLVFVVPAVLLAPRALRELDLRIEPLPTLSLIHI